MEILFHPLTVLGLGMILWYCLGYRGPTAHGDFPEVF